MKTFLLGSAAFIVLGTANAALAADMPALVHKAPAAAVYNWTGCYLGVHAGGGVLFDQWAYRNGQGGLAGVQAGCNYQVGQIVVGVEGEGWWSGLSSRFSFSQAGFSATYSDRNRSNGDIAVRTGVAIDRALVYTKVGVAWGRYDLGYIDTDTVFFRGSGTVSGLLLGTGLEYAIADKWTAKVEYNYIGQIGRDLQFDAGPAAFGIVPFTQTFSATQHIVKVGLNYRLGETFVAVSAPPFPSKAAVYKAPVHSPLYNWTGCYAGLHGGTGVLYDHFVFINGGGGLVGAQIGCNYQTGVLVAGVEAEGAWSGLRTTLNYADPFFTDRFSSRNRWDVDLALRGGLAIDRALVFGKVGVAVGRFDFAEDGRLDGAFRNASGTLNGLLLGAGLEYAVAGNWTAKLEYDYIGYLGRILHFNTGGGFIPSNSTLSATSHIVKAGLNYKTGEPVAAAATAMSVQALLAPLHNWTGCYAGVHAGGGVMYDHWVHRNGGGGLAGGQLGCDYQSGRFVVGIEGEGWWSGLASRRDFASATGLTRNNSTARNSSDADIALRGGVAVERALIFGKAGVARGRFDFASDNLVSGAFNRGSATLTGLLVGGGLEYAFAAHWSGKVEYNYIGYNSRDVHFLTRTVPFDENVSAAKQIVKAGINYRLGWDDPVVAKY
jgi:outer membrane immunogenic protein